MVADRSVRIVGGIAAIVLFGALLTVAGRVAAPGTPAAAGTTTPPPPVVSTAPAVTAPPTTTTIPPAPVPASTELATPHGSVATFATPGGPQSGEVGVWYGYQLTLPVLADQGDWLQVRLPQRPNGAIAWVRRADVDLGSTPYHVFVRRGLELLTVYRAGQAIITLPVGVGTARTPTPLGAYFITVHAPPPNAAYGPFVLSTSAHSEAIQSWEGAGDAIIAIHGPIDSYADSLIGTGRAQVSNGCIRMHDADLALLSGIPIGTPLDITA